MKPIRASYETRCGLCGAQIDIDEEIVKVDDEWCHAECAEGEEGDIER